MERISDTITSVFHIDIRDKRPVLCSKGDGAIVWSETFGLGWRFGISYNSGLLAKVRLHLDHNHSHTEKDQAVVTVSLRDRPDGKDAETFNERVTTINDFGHGQPALLGSWSPHDLVTHPFVSLTVTTKARIPQTVTDPLESTALAVRQSMVSGDFVDTKFYAFSAKRPGSTAGKPRVVYASSDSISMALPKSGSKDVSGSAPAFLVNMTSDDHINEDSVLHEYEYEQDSDLDDDEELDLGDVDQPDLAPSSSKAHTPKGSMHGSTEDEFSAGPPAYSVSSCRTILVKGVAHRTWSAYVYFRYTGQVSFLPLKSARGSPQMRSNDPTQPPRCSPKSMFRLAFRLGDERMKELAFRAIKKGLSRDNIVDEAFSWFTAQYPIISEDQVDRVFELRKSSKVSSALKCQLKAMTLGEKPWATNVLIAIMDKLNPTE